MNLELEAYEGELRDLRKIKTGYDAAMRIVKSTYPDKFPDTYFISGQGGDVDKNGLPDRLYVCPAYGVDWVVTYKKVNI